MLQAVEREPSSSGEEETNDSSNKLKNITNSNTSKSQAGASLFVIKDYYMVFFFILIRD